jgi:chromate transporter
MLLPGPEAQQLATYIGWLMHRTPGGIVSGGLFVLLSLLILIVLFAACRIGSRVLKNSLLWPIAVAAYQIFEQSLLG